MAHPEVCLSSFSVGMWSVRRKPQKPIMLFSLAPVSLVVLLDRTRQIKAQGNVAQEAAREVVRRVKNRSPFELGSTASPGDSGDERPAATLIVAIEIPLDHVVGLHYVHPLVTAGMLVLESRGAIKRVFASVSNAMQFYGIKPSLIPGRWPDGYSELRADGGVADSIPTQHCFSPTDVPTNQRASAETPVPYLQPISRATSAARPIPRSGGHQWPSQLSDLAASPSKVCTPAPLLRRRAVGLGMVGVANADGAGCISDDNDRSGTTAWPAPAMWTVRSQVFDYRTIILRFDDEKVPLMLRPVVESDERLLKLYESGLPSWAIYMPSYGFVYRPWFRTVTWNLFICISVFSLLSGFYDLYRHSALLSRLLSGVHLPALALRTWLDRHVKLRLSILLMYIVGNSTYALMVLSWATRTAAHFRQLTQPVVHVLGPPLTALRGLVMVLSRPFVAMAAILKGSLSRLLLPLRLVATGVTWAASSVVAAAVPAAAALRSTGHAAPRTAPAFNFLPLEKCAKGLQSTARFVAHIMSSLARHRLTLMRRSRRRWQALVDLCIARLALLRMVVGAQLSPAQVAVAATSEHQQPCSEPLVDEGQDLTRRELPDKLENQ